MRSLNAVVLLCLLSWLTPLANASPTTYHIVVTTFGNILSADYTLTLDPSLTYTNATAGLVVNSLQAGVQDTSGFTYRPSSGPYSVNTLTIGGLLTGATSVSTGTNDYYVAILGFPADAVFNGAAVTQVTSTGNYTALSGTVSVTQVAAAPEPSSLLLLATGLLGTVAAIRRRCI